MILTRSQKNSREQNAYSQKAQKGFVTSSVLILVCFASVFFPRIIEAIGAPSLINFVHLGVVPVLCAIVITTSKVKYRQQLTTVKAILIGLLWLLVVTTASALLNSAGWINIFLELSLLTEPFILLAAILSVPFTIKSLKHFRKWIVRFCFIHLVLAFSQKIALDLGVLKHTRLTVEDNIQGVFYLSSGGHVVSAAVSIIFSFYYYISAKLAPIWIRGGILALVFFQILFADAKQTVLVIFVAWALLILSRIQNVKTTLQYLIAALLLGYIFYWCIYNIDMFSAYRGWIRPEIYGPDGDATLLKTVPFRLIPTHYTSFFNWLLGLGPGHTIGRIGGWMLKDYGYIFETLGATTHPVSDEVWATWIGNYLDSSFFSPFWGWAAIWGDLGFLGLASFIFLWGIVWVRICKDDFSRLLVLSVIVNGFIFTLMEEPGFVMTTAIFLGLRWHELNLKKQ